ncbi:MAG: tRNA lysidine(34) synthetase TilS [Phycisphaeraceae bacterium]|nr:tRNA lysidine(34) synthetase TilS [Phycisphaeraceae bacterium]
MVGPPTHYHPMVRSVARGLRQRCGVSAGASIVVACSGGADSVALLRALAMLAERRKWRLRLVVGHVQHHLRGEAEEDAAFVEALAQTLGLPFARRDIRPADLPGNLEANARRLRYAALGEIAQEHHAPFIATAHHADDQLETLLMRILRGTSVAGLRGIAWDKPLSAKTNGARRVIRPMLGVDQQDIAALLDQLAQPWREDATNDDTSRTRARLRHDVLPVLKDLQPDAPGKANDLIDHFREVHELVQHTADQTQSQTTEPGVVLGRDLARTMNRAVLTEVLRRALISAGCNPGRLARQALRPAAEAAQDSVGGTRTLAFSNNTQLVITREHVTIQSPARSCL